MANGKGLTRDINVSYKEPSTNIVDSIFGTTRDRLERAQIEAQERIAEKQLEQKAKRDNYELYLKYEKQFPYLSDKRELASVMELNEIVAAMDGKYDRVTSNSEKIILQDMQTIDPTTSDWREIVSGWEKIKNNPDSFYLETVDGVATEAMKKFQNLEFINALNVQKVAKESERQRLRESAGNAAADIEAFDNAILRPSDGQPPEIGEDEKKLLEQDLLTYSERLLELESEIKNLDNQVKNPLSAGLNIVQQERNQRKVKFEKEIGTNKMDSMMESDAGPVVNSQVKDLSEELKTEDELIQEIVDLEISGADIDEGIEPFVSRTEEGNLKLSIEGEVTLPTAEQIVEPFNQNRINALTRTINSDSATEQMKDTARRKLVRLQQ
tara:strand:+ start:6561 stop:7709 length:1149 start_codon:yes stop_codon:yes gene_type:complete